MTLMSALPPGLAHKLVHFSTLVSQGDYANAITVLAATSSASWRPPRPDAATNFWFYSKSWS